MRPRDEQKIDAIFAAVIKLTGSVGIAGLKMTDIAREAGVADGTLYTYFRNKEELLNSVYYQLKRKGVLAIVDGSEHLPVKIQLYKMWESSLKYLVTEPAETIFLEHFRVSPFISEDNKKLSQQLGQYLERLLERGKEEMIIKPLSNELLISLLTGFLKDYTRHLVNHGLKVTEARVQESFALSWDAIKA
ncbi:MAG: TetR/AcrR family transcriptional regulator [Cyclobacteriaceae bacterium]